MFLNIFIFESILLLFIQFLPSFMRANTNQSLLNVLNIEAATIYFMKKKRRKDFINFYSGFYFENSPLLYYWQHCIVTIMLFQSPR